MNRTGETLRNNFGSEMIITTYNGSLNIDVYFPEYNWTAEHRAYVEFKKGALRCPYEPRVYGVGYVGEGEYNATENGRSTRVYDTWHDMLRRCYDPKSLKKYRTYTGCEVCEEWHNFQNFASWYDENYYEICGERMVLDKDILTKGNKVYSPETCCFVSNSINLLFTKRNTSRGELPIGVCFDKRRNKYKSQCNIGTGKTKFLGNYNTKEEAFNAYKQFKEALIKKVANNYLELIPFNLYQAMIDYEVDIDD